MSSQHWQLSVGQEGKEMDFAAGHLFEQIEYLGLT